MRNDAKDLAKISKDMFGHIDGLLYKSGTASKKMTRQDQTHLGTYWQRWGTRTEEL
jgi:hypothetical protein